MSIEFQGLDAILEEVGGIADPERMGKALMRACLYVEGEAKKIADTFRDTGELGRSITSRVEEDMGIVYTPLHYAPYVEYGTGLFAEEGGRTDVPWCYKDDKGEWHTTSGRPPHPFMRPALDQSREEVKRILREGLMND
jgi:HK97 gp10 family phage protein